MLQSSPNESINTCKGFPHVQFLSHIFHECGKRNINIWTRLVTINCSKLELLLCLLFFRVPVMSSNWFYSLCSVASTNTMQKKKKTKQNRIMYIHTAMHHVLLLPVSEALLNPIINVDGNNFHDTYEMKRKLNWIEPLFLD